MDLVIVAVIVFLGTVSAASTPVSVHFAEDATFSWSLPASARGRRVRVVSPEGQAVLDWGPGCTVVPSPSYTKRLQVSCKDEFQVTFTLLGVKLPDEGPYTCRDVTSSGAQIEGCGQNLTLVPVSPKVHIEVNTSVATETGEKYLTLTCVVTEAAPPVPEDGYSWSYLPSPQPQLQPLVGKTRTLTLGPLTLEDNGQYFCQARNDQNNRWNIRPGIASVAFNTSCIVSSKAVVENDGDGYKAVFELVQDPGLLLVQSPNSSIITDWHPPCNFSVSDAFKNRVTNTSCDPCKRTLSFSLSSLTEQDLGWYQCYAGTIHAKLDSCSVELISKVPIQVRMEPVTPDNVVKGAEGSHLTLTCVVTQALSPVPEDGYSWSYRPSPQLQPRPLVGKTRTLTLGPLTREDRGQYFCQASNNLTNEGKISPEVASVSIDVSYLGKIKSSSDLKVNEGDPVNLTCSVDSKPAARLAWVVGEREVRHATATELIYVVASAACSDSKTYTCRASNPDLPGVERTTSTTLTVNCAQAGAGDGPELKTIVALLVIILVVVAIVVGFLVCRWRRRRRKTKKSLRCNPDEMTMESQETTRKQPVSPPQESNREARARTEETVEAGGAVADPDSEDETSPLIDHQVRKRPPSPSQESNSEARTGQTAEAGGTSVNLYYEDETDPPIDLNSTKQPVSLSAESNSEDRTRAEETVEAGGTGANLVDEERNGRVAPLKSMKESPSPSQESNSEARTEQTVEAGGMAASLVFVEKIGPVVNLKCKRPFARSNSAPAAANLDDEGRTDPVVDGKSRKRPPSPSQESHSEARTEETAEAGGMGANLVEEGRNGPVVDLKSMKRPPSPSQESNSKAGTDETAEAGETGASLEDEERNGPVVDLKCKRTPAPPAPLAPAPAPANLDDKGRSDPVVDCKSSERRSSPSQKYNREARTEETVEAGGTGANMADEEETDPAVDLNYSKGPSTQAGESTCRMTPRGDKSSKVDLMHRKSCEAERDPLLAGIVDNG